MVPNNIKLGSGTLFVQTKGGLEILGEIGEAVELEPTKDTEFAEDAEPIVTLKVPEEITLSLALVGETAKAAAESLARMMQEIKTTICCNCSNRRVGHLIKYGRTRRIRKKNLVRAFKMAAKEAATK